MSEEINRQSIIDEEHLKLLSLGYMISAGTTAFFSLFGLMYVVMGSVMGFMFSHMPANANRANQPSPAFIGWIFGAIGFAFMIGFGAIALLKLRAGFSLRRRTSRTFCMVVAAISCLEVPYGTVLGVLTFIVLGRETVSRLFEAGGVPPPTS